MSARITTVSLAMLFVANAGCSFITKFEGWESHQGGTAGNAGTVNGGQSAGGTGNAAGSIVGADPIGGSVGTAAGSPAVSGATSTGGNSPSGGTAGNSAAFAGASTGGQSPGGSSSIGGTSGVTGTSGGTATSGGTGGVVASGGNSTSGAATGGSASTSGGTSTGGGAAATGGVATAGAAATGGVAIAGAAAVGCPGTGGPTMVKLPPGFCIDSTEVTRAQYTAWLNTTTAATINAQDVTNCGWNTSFAPGAGCLASENACQGTACGNHPQVCVDWCDAYAYCKGVGKRLCGKIGGGSNAEEDQANANLSQWYNACTSGGVNKYPYGINFSATDCNGQEHWTTGIPATLAVGSLAGCQAAVPYAGVFDLSGNVSEWEDCCGTTPGRSGTMESTFCHVRGGGLITYSNFDGMTCGISVGFTRGDNTRFDVGFRCCSP